MPPVDGSFAPQKELETRTSGLCAHMGTCRMAAWQAVRASSAAPYLFDDFSVGPNRWQDGAIVANNPAVVAVKEARLLWPDTPIDCLVSLGAGEVSGGAF